MAHLKDDPKRVEKSRQARFTLSGVIAAKTPESAKKTHEALSKICATIVDSYRVANDGIKSSSEKKAAITSVTKLAPELDWLVDFAHQETDFCKYFDQIHPKLQQLTKTIENEVKMLKADFGSLEHEIESFPDVFDNLLQLLNHVTEFMKQCHAAEVCRVVDFGKGAYHEAYNLCHLEVKSNFVTQAQLLSMRSNEYQKATTNLVKIQEGANDDLQVRVDNAEHLLKQVIPKFIIESKEFFLSNNDPQLKEAQKHAYDDVIGCLDELTKIVDRIKVKYINTFDEDAMRIPVHSTPLERAVNDAMQAVAKLRSLPPDMLPEQRQAYQEAIPKTTKQALFEFDNAGATPEEKQELIRCVKQARDGPVTDFFHAQDDLNKLVEKVQANAAFIPTIPLSAEPELFDDTPGDLLAAAKALCASMKTLNIALDD
jgi:chemotaxis protein histidine kinase CheA